MLLRGITRLVDEVGDLLRSGICRVIRFVDADAASSCSMLVVSTVATASAMIQNFPIPFPIGLGMGGVLADACAWRSAKAVVSFLKARLPPCEAGLEVPLLLFSEPAIASTIRCNVAITVFRSICSNFLFQWRIYGNVQADVIISQAKKQEKNPTHLPKSQRKAYTASSETLK